MNNYYETLEVSKNASKEVIEKAYKVLAKKYHPDLQEQNYKHLAEQKMKMINEAYEVLSDDIKRKEYDIELKKQLEIERQIEYEKIKQEDTKEQNNTDNNYNEEYNLTKEQIKQEKMARKQYQEEQERIYYNYMRSLGYRVKERWTIKKLIKLLKIIGILLIVILIIYLFPPTHKLLIQTYEQNQIIKTIVDIIINIIQGFTNGIGEFIKSILKIK